MLPAAAVATTEARSPPRRLYLARFIRVGAMPHVLAQLDAVGALAAADDLLLHALGADLAVADRQFRGLREADAQRAAAEAHAVDGRRSGVDGSRLAGGADRRGAGDRL